MDARDMPTSPFTSPVISFDIGCTEHNVLSTPPSTSSCQQTFFIEDAATDWSIPVLTATYEAECPITYSINGPTLSGGYSSPQVSPAAGTVSFGFTDKKIP